MRSGDRVSGPVAPTRRPRRSCSPRRGADFVVRQRIPDAGVLWSGGQLLRSFLSKLICLSRRILALLLIAGGSAKSHRARSRLLASDYEAYPLACGDLANETADASDLVL